MKIIIPVIFIAVVITFSAMSCAVPRKSQLMSEGQRLYHTRCRSCHHLIDPAEFNDDEWVGKMKWMGRGVAGLRGSEVELILQYLQSANDDAMPEDPGKKTHLSE